MRALYLTAHFKTADEIALRIADRPRPKIKKGECLVQVHSSGVNPSDGLGAIGYFFHAKLPRIPGRDFAGVVVEGDSRLVGKKVWGTGGNAGLDFDGTHAEFLVLPETAIAEIPNNLSLLEAGGQTLPYVTAYYSLIARARMAQTDTVLVIGALGQVGHAAMSLCKWKRCKAMALVHGERSLQKAKSLGWDAYADVPSQPFDLVLNTVGNIYWDSLLPNLKRFGRIATISAAEGKRDANVNLFSLYRQNQEILGINSVDLNFTENGKLLNEMKPGFESGALQPLAQDPSAVFPLEKAELAYKAVLKGSGGSRVVLELL